MYRGHLSKQDTFFLPKHIPYLCTFQPLNKDTSLIRTLSSGPIVSGFPLYMDHWLDCLAHHESFYTVYPIRYEKQGSASHRCVCFINPVLSYQS